MTKEFFISTSIINSCRKMLSWFRLPTILFFSLLLFVLSGNDASAQEPLQNLFFGIFEDPYLTAALLVPGMIILYVRSQFTTGKLGLSNALLPYLTVSCVYYALVFPIANFPWIRELDYQDPLGWTMLVFFGPVIFGALLGVDIQRNYTRGFLRKAGLNTVHAVPSAWDWKFNKVQQLKWVVVTLKDGTQIGGFFGEDSFASSEPAERDIYLERSYRIDNEESYWSFESEEGILIVGEEIKTIEFSPVDVEED